jgi:hypothetical protein
MNSQTQNDERQNVSPDPAILSRVSSQSHLFDVECVVMSRSEYTTYGLVAYGEHVTMSGCTLDDAGARS